VCRYRNAACHPFLADGSNKNRRMGERSVAHRFSGGTISSGCGRVMGSASLAHPTDFSADFAGIVPNVQAAIPMTA
jgi:hypothetical protein